VKWPDNADGAVLARPAASGLDFDVPHVVDFNVDFQQWPPSDAALATLRQRFADVQSYPSPGGRDGYVLIRVRGVLSHDWVTSVQRDITSLMTPFGGVCESWGLLH
jgi:Regulator of ribonuclease activity B